MKKNSQIKIVFLLFLLLVLVVMANFVNAVETYIDPWSLGDSYELSDIEDGYDISGTEYRIWVNGEYKILDLPAGQTIPGSSSVAGYASDNIPSEHDGYEADVAAALRAAGAEDLAKQVEEGSGYYTEIEQTYRVGGKWYTESQILEEIAKEGNSAYDENGYVKEGTWTYNFWSLANGERTRSDEEHNVNGKGIWEKKVAEAEEPPLPPVPPTVTTTEAPKPSVTNSVGTTATPTPTKTLTKTPTRTPTPRPTPVRGDYELSYDCELYADKGGSIKGQLKIFDKDNIFGVENGNPIPTDEWLSAKGDTNYIGNLAGIHQWKLTMVTPGTWKFTGSLLKGWNVWDAKKSGDGYAYVYKHYTLNEDVPEPIPYREGCESYRSVQADTESLSYEYTPKLTDHSWSELKYRVTNEARFSEGDDLSAVVFNETLGGRFGFPVSTGGTATVSNRGTLPGSSKERVTESSRTSSVYNPNRGDGYFISESDFEDEAKEQGKGLDTDDYYSVKKDPAVTVTFRGTSTTYEGDSKVLTDHFGNTSRLTFTAGTFVRINEQTIRNRSKNDSYPSPCDEAPKGGYFVKDGSSFPPDNTVNNVRVHTPVHDEVYVGSVSKNQLMNHNIAPAGCKIVTLGDQFEATVVLNGSSVYYSSITTNLLKYTKSAHWYCGLCNRQGEIDPLTESFTHRCFVSIDTPDCVTRYFTAEVTSHNIPAVGGVSPSIGEDITNQPDNEYTIKRSVPVFVVGKMYDFEVRTTDDPGWKINAAENLSRLPIGEYGDNANRQYVTPIKLGYRAYFDLKTLSSATVGILGQPKLIYMDTNGNIDSNVEFWYRDSGSSFAKLSAKDITIKMNMSTTRGDVNNSVNYMAERAEMLKVFPSLNYNKPLNIGGLLNIMLTQDNSTITKYVSGDLSGFHAKCKRWYGEIYLPASTIVAPQGSNVTQVASGTNTKKSGYILVVFDKLATQARPVANGELVPYLGYHIAKDVDWNDIASYIMLQEKQSTGSPSGKVADLIIKDNIILPNGKGKMNIASYPSYTNTNVSFPNTLKTYPAGIQSYLEDYLRTDIPIIIYDVSQRANNDYETGGTH